MTLSHSELVQLTERVQGVLRDQFPLLQTFVTAQAMNRAERTMLLITADGLDAELEVAGLPETHRDLDPIRVFLRAFERQLANKLSGIVWPPHEPPVAAGDTVSVETASKVQFLARVVAIDFTRDQVTLARAE